MSINCVTVFTSVAAADAFLANSTICCAWDLVYPCAIKSASVYAPDNCFNVSVNTSVVNHSPFVKLSLKLPYFFIMASAPVPSCSDVLIKASWNSLPPIPAFTTEFQSARLTLPAANA